MHPQALQETRYPHFTLDEFLRGVLSSVAARFTEGIRSYEPSSFVPPGTQPIGRTG